MKHITFRLLKVNIITDRPALYKAVGNRSSYFGRQHLEHKAARHCSRDKTLSGTTYKRREIEGNYIPAMSGLLTEKQKCKQIVSVKEKRGLSMVKQFDVIPMRLSNSYKI
jgi:hypothetical protein